MFELLGLTVNLGSLARETPTAIVLRLSLVCFYGSYGHFWSSCTN